VCGRIDELVESRLNYNEENIEVHYRKRVWRTKPATRSTRRASRGSENATLSDLRRLLLRNTRMTEKLARSSALTRRVTKRTSVVCSRLIKRFASSTRPTQRSERLFGDEEARHKPFNSCEDDESMHASFEADAISALLNEEAIGFGLQLLTAH
jgi:hypothetical protein